MALRIAIVAVIALAALLILLVVTSRRIALRAEREVPPLGSSLRVAGIDFHYLDIGAGPAVVLIHGLAGQLRNFTYGLVDRLTPNFRVIAIDRPGSGYSTRGWWNSARPDVQAVQIAALLDALEIREPLVVGHSLGGVIALLLAAHHPGRVRRVALIAPLVAPPSRLPAAFRKLAVGSRLLRVVIAWTLAVPATVRNSKRIAAAIFSPSSVPDDFAASGGGLLSLRPMAFYGASSDLVAVDRALPALVRDYERVDIPVHMLLAKDDRVLPCDEQRAALAAFVPGADVRVVDGGHMLPVTHPELVAHWLEELGNRQSAELSPSPADDAEPQSAADVSGRCRNEVR